MTRDESKSIFDCAQFLHDFRSLLGQTKPHPTYPQRQWHNCLGQACQLDNARALKARYAALDVYRIQIEYRERIQSDGLPRMNGQILHITPSPPEIESPILHPTKN